MGECAIKFEHGNLIPVCSHLGDDTKTIGPSDSDVFRSGDNCIKIYHTHPEVARIYGKMQYSLSQHEGCVGLSIPIPLSTFFREGDYSSTDIVNSVRFRCIQALPQEIEVPAEYRESGASIGFVLPFIHGRTLHDVYWSIVKNQILIDIIFGKGMMRSLQDFYSRLGINLKHQLLGLNQLAGINIKITGYDGNKKELQLLITDIAADIEYFVRKNMHIGK